MMEKYLGIEFGSTRIKGVLINQEHQIIASGSFTWENALVQGKWTYSLELAKKGLRACYKELKQDFERKYGEKLSHIDAAGISGMMHGYLVFDNDDQQLAEFRTWRNTITAEASEKLTSLFEFHVPQRWSIAHIYQAILNKESEVASIAFATTLAGYFHYLLTGEKVIGVGEASGMFPIDRKTCDYEETMLQKFDHLVSNDVGWHVKDIFPRVLLAGVNAGSLTSAGRDLLDESGELEIGVPFCPPEGDMGTGMVCTNSIRPGTGNASIGTSSNVTIITDAQIGVYPEIDVIMTPTGKDAALVHVNNGTSEINVWERLFKQVILPFKKDVSDGEIYSLMFRSSLEGEPSCKGLYPVDYFSGEPIAKVNEGKPMLLREPDADMSLPTFMRSHMYSLLATIRLGVDLLREQEGIHVNKIIGHGGFFKTPEVGERMLSAATDVPVATLPSAGEGGPYGEAILAAYMMQKEDGELLEDYLERAVFAGQETTEIHAEKEEVAGFNHFMEGYRKALHVERFAIKEFKNKAQNLDELKKEVHEGNMRLQSEELVTLTWGNVSAIDREKGVIVIKPSGVPYEKMKAEDMVVLDLEGHVIEGKLNPSSDTPTHVELYRAFPHIRSVVHTHSTYAVAFAQARSPIPSYGTTHADTFYGEVPCTRLLNKEEIENDYEANTGMVIVETFANKDYEAVPGVLVAEHGPFTWGASVKDAVDHAVILEKVAQMALLTKRINPNTSQIDPNLEQKHYDRKHGKNAYYGQKEKNEHE